MSDSESSDDEVVKKKIKLDPRFSQLLKLGMSEEEASKFLNK